jgi:hypothetical protein
MKPPSENAPTPRSPIGCGCGAAMALALAVVMGLAWFSYSRGRRFEKELQDPAAREARSREILGYRALPEGYHPLGGFSVPFIQDMAMLSDREPEPGEELSGPADAFGRRGFIYLEARSSDDRAREVEAYFEGESEHSEFFLASSGGAEVRYVAERGRMTLRGEELPTILARLLMVCPEQTRLRVAMWFEPPPEEAAPPSGGAEGAAPLAGTPADPAALRRFLDHFRLCG